ncbi:hypothetical protein HHI_06544 [Hyphomonas hirschiana VP5]|uniref:Uncharacterized protein n=1 Tax=Hyphomonas hirschiana VP5 TaxID=1280951 RepID=A0A059FXW0_9PROT|nr:hypothetical protein [Hyphomonas neptunium]KCZ95308.1 hypothetical protein HHI_06544 [Hyphomonas hirschiana VP5]
MIVYFTTLIVIVYALFLGAFLGWRATGFTIAIWFALVYFSSVASLPVSVVLSLTVSCLLVLVPVNLDFASFSNLSNSIMFAFKVAANVDLSASLSDQGSLWWRDILVKFIAFLVMTGGCAIARAKEQNKAPNSSVSKLLGAPAGLVPIAYLSGPNLSLIKLFEKIECQSHGRIQKYGSIESQMQICSVFELS